MPREITAFSNPLIKRVRNLRDKRHRREEGLFLAEGLRILTEAREAGHLPEYLFFAKGHDTHPLAAELIAAAEAAGGEVIATDSDILSKLSGKDNPGAVVGVYRELATDLARLDRTAAPIWLVAERLRDPGNLGTILRTADAVDFLHAQLVAHRQQRRVARAVGRRRHHHGQFGHAGRLCRADGHQQGRGVGRRPARDQDADAPHGPVAQP